MLLKKAGGDKLSCILANSDASVYKVALSPWEYKDQFRFDDQEILFQGFIKDAVVKNNETIYMIRNDREDLGYEGYIYDTITPEKRKRKTRTVRLSSYLDNCDALVVRLDPHHKLRYYPYSWID